MRATVHNEKGFSLVEVMVVMIMLAVAIIPMATLQTRSNNHIFRSVQRTEALEIAQSRMERIKAGGFADAVPDSGLVDNFTWRVDVQDVGIGLRSVSVTVQWQVYGFHRSVEVDNLMSSR
jgi:prepilin-type N-terminal cleavage/methylation domain-containing protein